MIPAWQFAPISYKVSKSQLFPKNPDKVTKLQVEHLRLSIDPNCATNPDFLSCQANEEVDKEENNKNNEDC